MGDFEWIAVDAGDVTLLALAFGLGLLAQLVGLPPLVGYLAAGFLLAANGVTGGPLIDKLSDLGITLLLFTVGLKMHVRTLARPQVWAVSIAHMVITVLVLAAAVFGVARSGVGPFAGLDAGKALLIGFALSFSSTVFAVKTLEARAEMSALHGQIAIGILIMQDIAAVVFLALSTGKLPSAWALGLLLLVPLRGAMTALMQRVGHGELLVLYGFLLALGGAELFELVELKGDLGALVLGVLVAHHPKADELAKRMLGFKDLFLVAFFLSIGLSGALSPGTFLLGAALAPIAIVKAAGFFLLLTQFRLRARTALLASLNLANFSEFGLIVAAIGVSTGMITAEWLAIVSIALSVSFVIAALLNARSRWIYASYSDTWRRWQSPTRLRDDRALDIGNARVAIIGMGSVGTGAYDEMREDYVNAIVGIDIDPDIARAHREAGRNVVAGDPSDADFWDRVQHTHRLELVLIALPTVSTSVTVLRRLGEIAFEGQSAAIAKYPDEARTLEAHGADTVYNLYAGAGAAFAGHVAAHPAEARPQ